MHVRVRWIPEINTKITQHALKVSDSLQSVEVGHKNGRIFKVLELHFKTEEEEAENNHYTTTASWGM